MTRSAGKSVVEKVNFSPNELLNNLLSLFQPQCRTKRIGIEIQISARLPEQIFADETKIRQVLTNLVSNAIKFTDTGSVKIEIASGTDHANEIVFTVSDTGIGIDPERLHLIFEPFMQADGSITRKFGGSGLGLSISKRYVELMGGKIWVESKCQGGSKFSFSIPL